jgi:FkbM family methyltransferase
MASLRQWLRRSLRRHPRLVVVLSRVARAIGLGRAAARAERAADLTRVAPPPPARPFYLSSCDGRDQVATDVGMGGWSSFERPLPAVLAAIARHYCDGQTFADIGANTGYYALLVWAVQPAARIDAFEPYPPALAIVRRNCLINRAGNVDVYSVAVGAVSSTAPLHVPSGDHGLIETSSSLNPEFDTTRIGHQIEVEVTTLDDFYRGHGHPPAVLKIDVETVEAAVLEGASGLLGSRRPILVVEVLPSVDPDPLEALRDRFGYTDIRLLSDAALLGGPVVADDRAWNHLWCPADELPQVLALLRDVGLTVEPVTAP